MKIGILLPPAVDLGLLRRARQLSLLIGKLKGDDGKSFSAAIGLPEPSEREWRRIEHALREGNPGTVVRHLQWELVAVENALRMFTDLPEGLDLEGISEVAVPRDWGWNFRDCDALIVFADPNLGAILPLRPTAFYCSDLAVRIVPEAWARSIDDDYWQRQTDAFRIWRQTAVVTADAGTVADIVSYAGVRPGRVTLAPNLLDHDSESTLAAARRPSSLLAWFVGDPHLHDLHNAAIGLQTYLSEGGSLEPVLVYDTVGSRVRDDAYGYLQSLPAHLGELLYGLPSYRLNSERELFRFLLRTGALWSSRLAGGEGEVPLLAAQVGLPFLGLDYEVNRTALRTADKLSALYAMDDPLAIADALHRTEILVSKGEVVTQRPKRRQSTDRLHEIEALLRRLVEDGVAE